MTPWMLPLEVFDGWETPTPVSTMHYLLICLLGPLALGLVITAIAWTPRLMGRGRDEARAAGLIDEDREAVTVGGASAARRSIDA